MHTRSGENNCTAIGAILTSAYMDLRLNLPAINTVFSALQPELVHANKISGSVPIKDLSALAHTAIY